MLYLITGGSASGKSKYAEEICIYLNDEYRYYLATMMPFGDGAKEKIARHRELRKNKGFIDLEIPKDIHEAVFKEKGTVLIEDIGNLAANEMFCENPDKDICRKIVDSIKEIYKKNRNVVAVTDNVFEDGFEYEAFTDNYMKLMGEINFELAKLADSVVEVINGIPVYYKRGEENV